MNTPKRRGKFRKVVYAAVVLVAVTAVVTAAAYPTVRNGGTEEVGHAEAVELTHEEGLGHEGIEEVREHGAGHHDAAVMDEHEADAGGMLEITLEAVEGRPWRFEPSVVEVPVGHPVKLTLVNDGRVEHDVEIDRVPAEEIEVAGGVEHRERLGGGHHNEGVVAAHAEPGTTATVIFTPTEVGEYELACTIPGHKEAGMVGKLVVTP